MNGGFARARARAIGSGRARKHFSSASPRAGPPRSRSPSTASTCTERDEAVDDDNVEAESEARGEHDGSGAGAGEAAGGATSDGEREQKERTTILTPLSLIQFFDSPNTINAPDHDVRQCVRYPAILPLRCAALRWLTATPSQTNRGATLIEACASAVDEAWSPLAVSPPPSNFHEF